MIVNLKTMAGLKKQQSQNIEIKNRLPSHLLPPSIMHCQFDVRAFTNYYLLTLSSKAVLTIECQRCLSEFAHPYSIQTELAICDSDETAERLMNHYDCIVSDDSLDLTEVLTDELYLYAPEFHLDYDHCNQEIESYINLNKE
ncbi:MAG: DUF177 domain-containing protein [Tatlockia sp.]|nr:DUF177 domain-containing protein [Tatlockia sp.]